MELIDAKQRGEEVVTTTDEPGNAEVVDLMAKLEQSVEAARRRRPGNAHQAEPVRRRGDDLMSTSMSELYEAARDLDVPGRSSMTKDELVEAIRAARTSDRRAS